MSALLNFGAKLLTRIVDFLQRKRSISGPLLKYGFVIVISSLASGWALGVMYLDPQHHLRIDLKTTDGVPSWVALACLAFGLTLMVLGVVIGVRDWWGEKQAESKRKSIVVELRGLHSSPDTPVSTAQIGLPKGGRDCQTVDFRPPSEGQLVDAELALEKISAVKLSVEAACGGRAKEDITIALGGLAGVPCLFLAGMLFDDETNVVVYDWDRSQKVWRLTDELDDGKRMLPFSTVALPVGTKEVVLAVSVSYSVDESAIARTFDLTLPTVHLRSEEMLADRFWSLEKQQAFVRAFRDAVQQLMALGIERIQLVLAAPASLCIRMGMAYDRRLMPDLFVHQYERTAIVPYPWAFRMPTHGIRSATVVRPERH